jgi:hypothetical protein
MYGIKNPKIGCMESKFKSSWIECIKSEEKKNNLNMGCTESNKKNLEIGCMESKKKTPEIECMKWEFKSNIWMYSIGKFHNWTMDIWNRQKKNSKNWMYEMGI